MNATAATEAYRTDSQFAAAANDKWQGLLARSATDMEFRAKLLSDSPAAIAEFARQDLSAMATLPNVKFIENTADATFVLPDFIDDAAELSDAELEAVAGGVTPGVIVVTTATPEIAGGICAVAAIIAAVDFFN